ncbi:unnamed protein product, partial [Amoebophrya sp. A25]
AEDCDNSEAEEEFDDDLGTATDAKNEIFVPGKETLFFDGVASSNGNTGSGSSMTTTAASAELVDETMKSNKPAPMKKKALSKKGRLAALRKQLTEATEGKASAINEVRKTGAKLDERRKEDTTASTKPTRAPDAVQNKDEEEELLPEDIFTLDEHEDRVALEHGESDDENGPEKPADVKSG